MTELQVKRPRNLVDSMLPRQFAGRSPQRLRNPLPAFPLLPPTLQSQVHLPHRCRNIRPALRWAVVRIRHRSTLSATISSGHARLPKAHVAAANAAVAGTPSSSLQEHPPCSALGCSPDPP